MGSRKKVEWECGKIDQMETLLCDYSLSRLVQRNVTIERKKGKNNMTSLMDNSKKKVNDITQVLK